MITDAELAAIRQGIRLLLPSKAQILEVTRTPDGSGGVSESWGTATAGVDVACRLDPLRGREEMHGLQAQPFHAYMLTLPHGTAITARNRVEIGSNTYAVISVDTGKVWSASVRCIVEVE